MTAFSLRARLHFGANSDLALSLPQSRLCILRARQLPPQREPRRLPPQTAEFPRRKKCSNRFSVNAFHCRGYNPSVKPLKAERLDSSPYTGEPRSAFRQLCACCMRRRRTSHAKVILINFEEHSQQGSKELRAAPDDDFHKKHLRQNFFSDSVKTQ